MGQWGIDVAIGWREVYTPGWQAPIRNDDEPAFCSSHPTKENL